jgi:transposase
MWPGNTADVTTLIPAIDRLRARFAIARVCAVADRGMISAETLAELEDNGFLQADWVALTSRDVSGSGEAEKSTRARRRPNRKVTNGVAISTGGRPQTSSDRNAR